MIIGTIAVLDTLTRLGAEARDAGARFHWGLAIRNGQSNETTLEEVIVSIERTRAVNTNGFYYKGDTSTHANRAYAVIEA